MDMIRIVDRMIHMIGTDLQEIHTMIAMDHLSQIVMRHHHHGMRMIVIHLCHGKLIRQVVFFAKNRF